MGTPRKYDPKRHPLIAQGMAIQGATAAEIAAALGVGERTVTTWMSSHEEFAEAVTLGRERADARVLSSLYQKAIGGDTTACIYWLKCRQPKEWRDRQEIRQEITEHVTASDARRKLARLLGCDLDPTGGE